MLTPTSQLLIVLHLLCAVLLGMTSGTQCEVPKNLDAPLPHPPCPQSWVHVPPFHQVLSTVTHHTLPPTHPHFLFQCALPHTHHVHPHPHTHHILLCTSLSDIPIQNAYFHYPSISYPSTSYPQIYPFKIAHHVLHLGCRAHAAAALAARTPCSAPARDVAPSRAQEVRPHHSAASASNLRVRGGEYQLDNSRFPPDTRYVHTQYTVHTRHIHPLYICLCTHTNGGMWAGEAT